jgi:hypothetical protein
MVPDFQCTNKQKQPTRKEIKQMQVDRSKRSAVTMYTLEDGFIVTDCDTENEEDVNSRCNGSDYVEGLVVRNDDKDHVSEHGDTDCCSTEDNVGGVEKQASDDVAETEEQSSQHVDIQPSEAGAENTLSV